MTPRPRLRTTRSLLIALAAAALLAAGGITYAWVRHEDSFCTKVHALPDVLSSVSSTGTPSAGLLDSAAKLDSLADAAPDDATATAARALATAQRSLGEALAGSPTGSSAVGDVVATTGTQLAQARATLDAAIAKSCH